MRLVLLGAPGSGKGTQAAFLKKRYGCIHVSTGDIFRENLRNKTPLGLEAEGYMSKGALVPDEVVVKMVSARLREQDAEAGFLLDGFPRTVAQAEFLDAFLQERDWPLDAVVLFAIDEEKLVQRLVNRRTCRSCGKIYNLLRAEDGFDGKKCPACDGEIYQREDDSERVIRNRLKVFGDQTAPLIAWYEKKELLRRIDVSGTPEEAFEALEAVLG